MFRVEIYGRVRRAVRAEGPSQRTVARDFGLSQEMVWKVLQDAVPPGYQRLHVLLRREGETVNHKRVHRVYREAGLSIRRKKWKHCVRGRFPLREHTAANQEWAIDFVYDAIAAGRSIRVLSVVDAYTRECLALEVDTSFASQRVTRALDQIIEQRGQTGSIPVTTDLN